MPCRTIEVDGVRAIVCGPRERRRRCACGKWSTRLCDWKVKGKKSGTCDKPLCDSCAHEPAAGKDLCPDHTAEWNARNAR